MSEQQAGYAYLRNYSGILKIIEQVLNVTIVFFLFISGYELKSYFLSGTAFLAFFITGIFLFTNILAVPSGSKLPWFWIECVNALVTGLLFMLSSSVVVSLLTRSFIITGIVGYVNGVVYFIDAVDKYSLAITPRAKYVWNVPNIEGEED